MSELRCSFCGKQSDLRSHQLLSGSTVNICSDCLRPCADIVGGCRDEGMDDARRRVSKLESAIKAIAREVTQVIPGPLSIRCMWCDLKLDSKDIAREHVATCERHPAVVELRKLQGRDT